MAETIVFSTGIQLVMGELLFLYCLLLYNVLIISYLVSVNAA
jgi:hypothetical protein